MQLMRDALGSVTHHEPVGPSEERLRTTVALVLLLLVGGLAQAQTRPSHCSYSSPPLNLAAPILLGWPDLERTDLAPGVRRELRMHHDVALTAPDYSMRIVEEDQRVTGEILSYWPGVGFNLVTGGDSGCKAWNAHEARELIRVVRQSQDAYLDCGPVQIRSRIEGCRVTFAADPGWAEMLRQSDSLGVWTISSPVPRRFGLDGVSILVEVRDRAGYRRYDYQSPAIDGGSGERQAAALGDLLQAALERAHLQSVSK